MKKKMFLQMGTNASSTAFFLQSPLKGDAVEIWSIISKEGSQHMGNYVLELVHS